MDRKEKTCKRKRVHVDLKPPMYVAMGGPEGLALSLDITSEAHARLMPSSIRSYGHRYWRAAGAWNVGYGWENGVLVAKTAQKELKHLNNAPLVEVTEEYWREDNGHYGAAHAKRMLIK